MISPFDKSISFEEKAFQIFEYQKANNKIYKRFCEALVVREVNSIEEIPLLPIQAFKDAVVISSPDSNTKIQSLDFFKAAVLPGCLEADIILSMHQFTEIPLSKE